MKQLFTFVFFVSCLCNIATAQYANTEAEKQNKFFLTNSNLYFASYDENYINDSIISGYSIKDIRGIVIANVAFKVGKKMNDDDAMSNLQPYTEIIFTTNFSRVQLIGFVCANELRNIFENLLYTTNSKNFPSKFTATYELDYNKVDSFCAAQPITYTNKIEQQYNPIQDYYNIITYTKNSKNCSSKILLIKPKTPAAKFKKYIPKKLLQ